MKSLLRLLCLCSPVFFSYHAAIAQKCKVSIADAHCNGSVLQAITDTTKKADTLTWYKNGLPAQVTIHKGFRSNGDTITGYNFDAFLPSDFVIDSAGNLYTDANCTVYKLTKATGIWTEVAGNDDCYSSGSIQNEAGLAVDSLGAVYVGEAVGKRVSKWVNGKRVGVINNMGYPIKLLLDNKQALYILDNTNSVVYKVPYGSGKYTVVAGGNGSGSALNQLSDATCMAMDNDQNLYIGERGNNRVTKWAPGAKQGVVVAAGDVSKGDIYTINPNDLEIDASRNLYILNDNNVIYWPSGSSYGILAGRTYPSVYGNPTVGTHISLDKNGNLYEVMNGYEYRFPPVTTLDKTYASANWQVIAKYNVRAHYTNACSVLSDTTTLIDEPYQPLIEGQTGGVCHQTLTYSNYYAGDPTNPTLVWNYPQGATALSGQGTDYLKLRFDTSFVSGTLSLTTTNACYSYSTAKELLNAPEVDAVNGKKKVSAGQQNVQFFMFSPEKNSTYAWTVPPGAVITKGQGTSTIYVTFGTASGYVSSVTTDSCGSVANISHHVNVSSSLMDETAMTATNSLSLKTGAFAAVTLYPQPAVNAATLRFTHNTSEPATLVVNDIYGKVVYKATITTVPGTNTYTIPVSALRNGTYLVSVYSRTDKVQGVKMLVMKP